MDNILIVGNELTFRGRSYRCAVGKSGFSSNKQEGDGCTPLGIFNLRECWYRADRTALPNTHLPIKEIHEYDVWCDDPNVPEYNTHRIMPFTPSHEKLWRDEAVYNLVIPIGYNDAPVVPGKGSAIFLHVAKPDYSPTEGCVAVSMLDLLDMLPYLSPESRIEIREPGAA